MIIHDKLSFLLIYKEKILLKLNLKIFFKKQETWTAFLSLRGIITIKKLMYDQMNEFTTQANSF